MKQIPLTQGKFALVDDCDYEYLMAMGSWYSKVTPDTIYAAKSTSRKLGKRHTIFMHQCIAERLGFRFGADHINRHGWDNQRHNLRDATAKQQVENRGISKNNTSGHKGIGWEDKRSKYRVTIGHNGKHITIGRVAKLEDAIALRLAAEKKYFTLPIQHQPTKPDADKLPSPS